MDGIFGWPPQTPSEFQSFLVKKKKKSGADAMPEDGNDQKTFRWIIGDSPLEHTDRFWNADRSSGNFFIFFKGKKKKIYKN